MRIALLLATFLTLALPAQATHLPRPAPGTCGPDGHGGILCVDPPTCEAPATLTDDGQCIVLPVLVECRILVRYGLTAPARARAEEPVTGCDRAGMELALAAVLARLLGAPLP